MELISDIAATLLAQLQQPTLAFLIGGMMLAALGSKFEIPAPIYKFIVIVLLLKVGLGAGMALREADFITLLIPALCAVVIGIGIVLLGGRVLQASGVSRMDAMATAGLFGAVSASTLAAGMAILDDAGVAYEGFIGVLYPFMDIAALFTAIILAKLGTVRAGQTQGGTLTMGGRPSMDTSILKDILTDTLRSPAISALILGLAIGLLGRPESVYQSFYEPLFRGLLSILMLIMGIEAWARLSELRKVAHVYVLYGVTAPLVHGALGFGLGLIAHQLTGFSQGGVVLLAVMAASSSDISGPPTMRSALPEANPSAYVGASTSLGTPVAILSIPLWVWLGGLFI